MFLPIYRGSFAITRQIVRVRLLLTWSLIAAVSSQPSNLLPFSWASIQQVQMTRKVNAASTFKERNWPSSYGPTHQICRFIDVCSVAIDLGAAYN